MLGPTAAIASDASSAAANRTVRRGSTRGAVRQTSRHRSVPRCRLRRTDAPVARFGFLSTYPPTRCGLATFTHALATAMIDDPDAPTAPGRAAAHEAVVVRVDDLVPAGPAVGSASLRIVGDLHPGDLQGRRDAAAQLNACDVVIVQHEFGIYGGADGEEILDVLARIERPVIVVMHTVLATPTAHEREVTIAVTRRAEAVVAMTKRGAALLLEEYGVPVKEQAPLTTRHDVASGRRR